ncbi:uncharacterized protein I206_103982 [Kwoniella pini CBS 10737]|uniref:Uncharacterized protein n=1 Tax=Kwoniella pini CBS 10737 TaxID=1296096 RepID=A0A1B9I2Z4_9TREE|nr:uncharacterized protein I206_04444 [Kwoniella pini CBS 10737]OCF49913.1 hypothetical protein I206_04444 [Kwoniella pini CBS 10737]
MPTDKIDKEPWGDEHTIALLRTSIQILLLHRSDIYSNPSLIGVSDNGGNRINMKLQQILKKLCNTFPGAENLVVEEVNNLKEARSKNGNGSNPSTPKKRKMKDEV